MAKYTETFMDWLSNGNEYPSSFDADAFPNLKDRFFARYCDKEIGYETEELFRIKFTAVADSKIPLYVASVKALEVSDAKIADPIKKTKTTNGVTKVKTTELPFDSSTSSPSSIIDSDENIIENETSGFAYNEAIALSEWNERIRDMEEKLLDEFNNLFMKVY